MYRVGDSVARSVRGIRSEAIFSDNHRIKQDQWDLEVPSVNRFQVFLAGHYTYAEIK